MISDTDEPEAHLADALRDVNPNRGGLGTHGMTQLTLDGGTSGESFADGAELFLRDFRDCIVGNDAHFIASEMCERVMELMAHGYFTNGQKKSSLADSGNNYIKASVQLDKMLRYIWDDSEKRSMNSHRIRLFALLHGRDFPEFDAILGNLNQAEFARTIITDWIPKINDAKGKQLKREAQHAMKLWMAHARRKCKAKTLTKAAVNNAVLDAQKHFGWEPRNDQRKKQSRENMSESRIKQLNVKPTP